MDAVREYVLTRLHNGDDMETICDDVSVAINAAKNEFDDKINARLTAAIKARDAIYDYYKIVNPEFLKAVENVYSDDKIFEELIAAIPDMVLSFGDVVKKIEEENMSEDEAIDSFLKENNLR